MARKARSRKGSRRREGKKAGRRGWRGVLILVLAGTGIWVGATLVDDGGVDLFRALDRDEDEVALVERPIPRHGDRVRVEVLNAGGVRGVAAEVRDELRDEGFDVVHYGNASRFDRDDSVVLLRSGGVESADAVAAVLGIRDVRSELDSTLLVEVTVLLGSSWGEEARDREEEDQSEPIPPRGTNQQPEGDG